MVYSAAEVTKTGCIGVRHVVTLLLILAMTIAYMVRVSMSMAIVAMTSHIDNETQSFEWSRATQDTILSSFFWGYVMLQVPAGMIASKIGGGPLIVFALGSNAIFNLIVPTAAMKYDWIGVVPCRVLMGLTQGLILPSIHGLLGQWAPVRERSRIGSFVYAGSLVGTVIEMALAGVLSSYWGWPSVFYACSAMCLLWCVLWLTFGSSSPNKSRWISKEERKYIEMNTGSMNLEDKKKMKTPWKQILTSMPFWAIFIAHCGQSMGYWTLLTEIPSYMASTLGVNVKSNGFLSAIPYLAMYIVSCIASWTADYIVNNNIVSLTASRKIFNTIALWGPAIALVGLSYLPPGSSTVTAVAILTITVGLNGTHFVGFLIAHIDLSPNFASTMMGITSGFSNILSIVAPYTVTIFVHDETDPAEWRPVFMIAVAFYFIGNLTYLVFMTSVVQDWNEPDFKRDLESTSEKKTVAATPSTTTAS